MTHNYFHRILICTALALLLGAPAAHAELIAWGTNEEDALCDGHTQGEEAFATAWLKSNAIPVSALAGGEDFVLVLSEGRVFACGSGKYGQLGREGPSSTTPVEVSLPGTIVQVAAGQHFALALTDTGRVYEWGESAFRASATPREVPGVTANSIAASRDWATAALTNGHVVNWGWGETEQFCNPESQVTNGNHGQPIEMLGVSEAREVADGYGDTYVLLRNGEVKSCGDNQFGELGDGVEGDGGQEGVLETVAGLTAREIGAMWFSGFAVNSLGEGMRWGSQGSPRDLPTPVPALSPPVSEMTGGQENAIALGNGQPVTWGNFNYGEAGASTLSEPVTSVGAGRFDYYAAGGGAPSPKAVTFTNLRLTGELWDQKANQSFQFRSPTSPQAGALHGGGISYGQVEVAWAVPTYTQDLSLFGIVPVGLDVAFTAASPLYGSIAPGSGEKLVINVSGGETMHVESLRLFGLRIPTPQCQTESPITLRGLSGEASPDFSEIDLGGSARIPRFHCQGGLLGTLFGTVLTNLFSGTENTISLRAEA